MKRKYRGKLNAYISVEDIGKTIWVDNDCRIYCEKGFKGNSRVLVNCAKGKVMHNENGWYIDLPEVVADYNFEVALKEEE